MRITAKRSISGGGKGLEQASTELLDARPLGQSTPQDHTAPARPTAHGGDELMALLARLPALLALAALAATVAGALALAGYALWTMGAH